MKKHFTYLTLSLLFTVGKSLAQVYTPVATTGYTLDAVAETTTAAGHTGNAIDGSDYVLYSNAYGQLYSTAATGLPNNGLITATNRSYQLQSYTGPNMLYIPLALKDSLTLTNPQPYLNLSLLGFATEGTGTMSITVRFTDNSTQVFSSLSLGDWFSTGTSVLAGFDRCGRTSGTPGYSTGNPRLFATDLAIACANQGKSVQRIIIKNNSGNGRICMMAVSAASPAYAVTSNAYAICNPGTATISATGFSTYTWQPVGTFTGATTSTIAVSPTSSTTYTLDGVNASSCPGHTVITIDASSTVPTLTFGGTTSTVCLGASATASASGAATYTWSNGVSNGGTFIPAATAAYTVTGGNGCGTSTAAVTITVTPLPVTATTANTLICAGSAATLTAGGATSYIWSPSNVTTTTSIVSPTASSVYTVSGSIAGGCHGSTTISLTTKAVPSITVSATATAICNGGVANLTALGNADTYTWNPGGFVGASYSFTPGVSGLYSVTGTNSLNCTSTVPQLIIIVQNPTITVSVSDPVICIGSTSTLTASGAATYQWNGVIAGSVNAVSPTSGTIYNVIGTSTANCVSDPIQVNVDVFDPTISVSSNTAICPGKAANLSVTGANSYLWSTGSINQIVNVSPTVTTVYSVTGSVDNGSGLVCDVTSSVTVTVNSNPTITAMSTSTNVCKGRTATLTADGAGATGTYTWTGGSSQVTSASTTVAPISNQSYTVTGTDANGCKSKTSISIVVSPCTGIANNTANSASLLIYPNPSTGDFTIKTDQTITLQIVNELGQHVRTITLNSGVSEETVNLSSGIYFISGSNENGTVKQKIVITK